MGRGIPIGTGLIPKATGPGSGSHLRGAPDLVAVGEELIEENPEAPDIRRLREDIVRQGLGCVPAKGRMLSTGC